MRGMGMGVKVGSFSGSQASVIALFMGPATKLANIHSFIRT